MRPRGSWPGLSNRSRAGTLRCLIRGKSARCPETLLIRFA
jgi:hypothetical protein